MAVPFVGSRMRWSLAIAATGFLAACEGPLDYDLRGQVGAFNTTEAAQNVNTQARPSPDSRGVISYPNYQVAVARRGDTVTSLSSRIGVSPGEVARFNGLNANDKLRDGEVVSLPRRVSEPAPGTGNVDIATIAGSAIDQAPDTTPVQTTTLAPAKPAAPAAPAGPEPIRHKVKRGETAYTVSRLYQVPVKSLAEWNGLGTDFAIREGQYLLIPVKDQPAPIPVAVATSTTAVSGPGQGSPTPTPPSSTTALPDEKISAEPPETPDVSLTEKATNSSARLGYPVTGKVIRTYAKGKNEGIDIAGSPGTAVLAAEAGTVAAITADADEVPIIVVRHKNNLLTVYANVSGIEVKKGSRVKRGQKIAQLRSGNDAYVHFEVRNGFESVDPEPYLN
ncbi:peptidoglycan DD-metalloendopeptidase family protein [Ruegeria hyattellae]|uniref:peptidoglycan DD-metalloendopeptidase family protein n=1 Tax=Ruegeria hyattellae TaxID=3233337 RepID=UPI00355C8E35